MFTLLCKSTFCASTLSKNSILEMSNNRHIKLVELSVYAFQSLIRLTFNILSGRKTKNLITLALCCYIKIYMLS